MMQSEENGQKPQFGQFFELKVIFRTNFMPKTKEIVRAVFEKNISVILG